MFGDAALKILRVPPVEFAGNGYALQDVGVKHNYSLCTGWPAIRSPEPVYTAALLRSEDGATEGTILRPEPGFRAEDGGAF